MSEDILEKNMSEDMSEDISEEMSIDMSKNMLDKNGKRYIRRNLINNIRE